MPGSAWIEIDGLRLLRRLGRWTLALLVVQTSLELLATFQQGSYWIVSKALAAIWIFHSALALRSLLAPGMKHVEFTIKFIFFFFLYVLIQIIAVFSALILLFAWGANPRTAADIGLLGIVLFGILECFGFSLLGSRLPAIFAGDAVSNAPPAERRWESGKVFLTLLARWLPISVAPAAAFAASEFLSGDAVSGWGCFLPVVEVVASAFLVLWANACWALVMARACLRAA